MHHFKLSAYNKVQATRKTDKSIQYIVVTEVTWWTIYSQDYMFKVVQKKIFKKYASFKK